MNGKTGWPWSTTTTSTLAGDFHELEKLLKPPSKPARVEPAPAAEETEFSKEARRSAKEALQQADKELDDVILWLSARIARANKMQLLGNLVSTVSGAGVVYAVFLESYAAAVVTALIAFLSSGCTLLGQYWLAPLYKEGDSMGQLYNRAISSKAELGQLAYELNAARGDAQVHEVAEKVHRVCNAVTNLNATVASFSGKRR